MINSDLAERKALSFHMNVLTTLKARGNTATRQHFYLALAMKGKGMSSNGVEMMSRLGIGLSRSAFTHQFHIALANERAKCRY
jgi:hypothetical protein